MNDYQRLWWEQTRSDHAVLLMLRRQEAMPCQQLHYLQMVTEKLGKAYFWRTGHPPPQSHVSFVRFLQALDSRSNADRARTEPPGTSRGRRILTVAGRVPCDGRVRQLLDWP
jgi:hypothetical protein